jgi:hypothetical protein
MNFTATRADQRTILAIVERFESICARYGVHGVMQRQELLMDVEACHCNGCPLRLEALLEADDVDFVHDIGGITTHLDRQTGALTDCFVPRYRALPASERRHRTGERRHVGNEMPYHWPEVDRRKAEHDRRHGDDAARDAVFGRAVKHEKEAP